jgi:hypothetical protein
LGECSRERREVRAGALEHAFARRRALEAVPVAAQRVAHGARDRARADADDGDAFFAARVRFGGDGHRVVHSDHVKARADKLALGVACGFVRKEDPAVCGEAVPLEDRELEWREPFARCPIVFLAALSAAPLPTGSPAFRSVT